MLHVGDGLDDVRGDQRNLVRDRGERLHGVQHHRGGGVHLVRVLAADDAAVAELDGGAGADAGLALAALAGVLGGGARGLHGDAVLGLQAELAHERGGAVHRALVGGAGGVVAEVAEIAADDLLPGGLAHDGVVGDAEADAVHAHVRGALVGAGLLGHLLPDGAEERERVDVAVVVDGGLAVGGEVVRIDHVLILEVDRRGLVGDVQRVLEGHVPDGEGLELGVTGLVAALALVVKLREAGGELAAAGAGRGDDDDRTLGGDVFVEAVTGFGDDGVDVGGIALGDVMIVDRDAAVLQAGAELLGPELAGEAGDHHAADEQAPGAEVVDQLEGVGVVGDAEVGAHLLALDVAGVDAEDDLGLVLEGLQEAELHVRIVAGQAAGGVEVVHQLAAELEVELAVRGGAALDLLRLFLQVLLVVESDFLGHGVIAPGAYGC